MTTDLPRAKEADIGLLLEGTFPFVRGGVSNWLNEIIRAFPEYRFALVFIGGRRQDYGEMRYSLPQNVVHLETHYIHDPQDTLPIRAESGDPKLFRLVARLHEWFITPQAGIDGMALLRTLTPQLTQSGGLDEAQFLFSEAAWGMITENYQTHCTDPSFVDYFWTVRSMHEPIWMLARVAEQLLPVRVYHSISTGYAGFLGVLLKQRTGRPLILTEHGIYTKERKIDLFQSQWVKENRGALQTVPTEISYFRQLWVRFFEALGRVTYEVANPITALYEANRQRQIQDGAAPERTLCIPNGIRIERFSNLRDRRPKGIPQVLAVVGRVVPIKDVKTFIRAMRTLVNRIPEVEGWIVGPEEEDREYVKECRNLVYSLGLQERVKFLGFRKVEEILPEIGLLVLSSISEALPLVLLEGFAAGVPAVVTDVGACRELIYGSTPEDEALGRAGRVVNLADPRTLARAAMALLTDEGEWRRAQEAAIRRVEAYYTEAQMFARYRAIYTQALG